MEPGGVVVDADHAFEEIAGAGVVAAEDASHHDLDQDRERKCHGQGERLAEEQLEFDPG